ncbi:hypothetical protein C0Q70_12411 [Pomacea canaliculata]|uniref:Uncharacterized protein n=1 Tax=Pomacea canaliculata TaxID=400727 RepID=A0A2T7P1H1_POMCA|nr:hypothetical protein C0Q70_12411 [Pomacea canaliculata]
MLVKEAGGCWKHAGPESMSRSLFSSAPRLAWPRPFSRDRVACGDVSSIPATTTTRTSHPPTHHRPQPRVMTVI